MRINPELERKIVIRMFADAERHDWTHLNGDQRSAIYESWMNDPEIGGRLTEFKSPQGARVWIKEGPMKEYSRAKYGVGKYAEFVANPIDASDLVARAMGGDWRIVPNTRKGKPLRVRIRAGDLDRHFAWAPADQLKHLVWAAIRTEALGDQTPWTLCLVGSFEKPTPADQRALDLRIGERCALEVTHVDDLA